MLNLIWLTPLSQREHTIAVETAGAEPVLLVAEEPKGDRHDRFVDATGEPLSG
ncbi:MAG: hypothetical protein M3T56_07875 [Chloroflexota bacterium]|nr:hypothetical protein [Chloroflexota bacterium]